MAEPRVSRSNLRSQTGGAPQQLRGKAADWSRYPDPLLWLAGRVAGTYRQLCARRYSDRWKKSTSTSVLIWTGASEDVLEITSCKNYRTRDDLHLCKSNIEREKETAQKKSYTMEVFNTNEQEFQELGIRVSRMRVSLRMKKKRNGSSSSEVTTEHNGDESTLRVPMGPSSSTSTTSNSSTNPAFRSRLSSSSSVCSTDSGFVSNPPRSRLGSSSSTTSTKASRQPGSILTKIAKSEVCKNADAEFSVFYRPRSAVSRSGSNSSTGSAAYRSAVRRSGSSVSNGSTGSRNRSISICSTSEDIYSTIEELCDVFEEAPPLPPRKARLRPPALPPYPSSAVTIVQNITETILCWEGENPRTLNRKIRNIWWTLNSLFLLSDLVSYMYTTQYTVQRCSTVHELYLPNILVVPS